MKLKLATGLLFVSICLAATVANETIKCASEDEVGAMCAADCKTLMVCSGLSNGEPVYSSTCASMNPKKPYCVGNTCTSTPDPSNLECLTITNFTCTSPGVFPDPNDCSTFYACNNNGAQPKTIKCREGFVYQLFTDTCVKSYGYCYTIDCTNRQDEWVIWPGMAGYYAYCGEYQTVMFKCEDERSFYFDLTEKKCLRALK